MQRGGWSAESALERAFVLLLLLFSIVRPSDNSKYCFSKYMSNHVSLCLMASLPFLLLVFVHAVAGAAAAASGNDDTAAAAASGNDDTDRYLQVASFAAKLRAEAGVGDEDGVPSR